MKQKGISGSKIALVYIGTVVGAGFATGQEIMQFFVAFGISGLMGIMLATLLFVVYGIIILNLGLRLAAESHLELIQHAGGKLFRSGMDILIMVSLFGSLTAMLAGTGALFGQQFNLPPVLGSAIMAIITALTVLRGLRGVLNAISAVVPFLLAAVIGISLFALFNAPAEPQAPIPVTEGGLMQNWLWAAILYASYNILMAAAVLGPLGGAAANRRMAITGGALGGIGLGVASLMIYLALRVSYADIQGLEVPILYLANQITLSAGGLFSVVLFAEIYTTAVGSLYGFSARLKRRRHQNTSKLIIWAAGLAFIASLFGFSNLVRYLYPLQGYGGLIFLVALLIGRRHKLKHY